MPAGQKENILVWYSQLIQFMCRRRTMVEQHSDSVRGVEMWALLLFYYTKGQEDGRVESAARTQTTRLFY